MTYLGLYLTVKTKILAIVGVFEILEYTANLVHIRLYKNLNRNQSMVYILSSGHSLKKISLFMNEGIRARLSCVCTHIPWKVCIGVNEYYFLLPNSAHLIK